MGLPRCVIFEDEHLLVINKPAGMNTHAPSPFAGGGIYEWLRQRQMRWAKLAIIHRLDKETSGVMVFGKTTVANRSLTEQFTRHTIVKKYRLVTDRAVKAERFIVKSSLVRAGERYLSRPVQNIGELAETRFRVLESCQARTVIEAQPITGRTHQIRAQAAAEGFPIMGDVLYGGTAAARVFLHATALILAHPLTNAEMIFSATADFAADVSLELRDSLLTPARRNLQLKVDQADSCDTDAYRLIHGAADGWPGWHVERLGEFLLSVSETSLSGTRREKLEQLTRAYGSRGAYHKTLDRHVRKLALPQASPFYVFGESAPDAFTILENGTRFELSFNEGYSVGLFLDQRDNRRRLLFNSVEENFAVFPNGVAGVEVLNTFAYTCGFSVCAAMAGALTTSLDLSKKYLEWGRRNFALNGVETTGHQFIYGDVFDWSRRLAKKGRTYDLVILDPPTFSHSKVAGTFQAEKDFGKLTAAVLPLVKPKGVLFASTNAARLEPQNFLDILGAAIEGIGRKVLKQYYAPQPPDFPVSRNEPAYLKTVWMQIG